jgi:DNA-binding NarL/FixJ family response regulator
VSETVRILVVDDDPQFRQLVKLVLRKVGDFEIVSEAPDGRTGIDRTGELHPDVVLLDLMMPGMDGFEALPLIKQAHPGTAVIVLTALDADEAEAEEGVLFGAAGFVEKRYIAERLETAIRGCAGATA